MPEWVLILIGYTGALLSVLFVAVLQRLWGWQMYRRRSVELTERLMAMWRDKYFAVLEVNDET